MTDTLRWFYKSRKALLAGVILAALGVLVALDKLTAEQAMTRAQIALGALGFTVAMEDMAKKARVTTTVAPGGTVAVTETPHGTVVSSLLPPAMPNEKLPDQPATGFADPSAASAQTHTSPWPPAG